MAEAESREEKGEEVADLSAAQVGDKLLVYTGGWSRTRVIKVVEKIGKLHVTAGGVKYRIDNGYEAGGVGGVGGRFGVRRMAELATAAMLAEVEEERRRQKLSVDLGDLARKVDELSEDQVARLAAVVSEWRRGK